MGAPTFMVIPSLSCQAACRYCFGPHRGAVMDEAMARRTAEYIRRVADETRADQVRVILHGGEPLMAPYPVLEALLQAIRDRLSGREVDLHLQSNLWNLDARMLELLQAHRVHIGTSLDGPRRLCDASRCPGYFRRTMAGIRLARAAGQPVTAIATLTRATAGRVVEIAQFFRDNGIPLVLHGAIAGIDDPASPFALTPDEYADAFLRAFSWYLKNRLHTRIETLDHYARGVACGAPGVCTFSDCLGTFVAISPTGELFPCQRFAGKAAFSMGNLGDMPSFAQLMASDAANRLRERQRAVQALCGGCSYLAICRGGCYYNALASGDGVVDPLCPAYKKIFAFAQSQLLMEMCSDENMRAVCGARPRSGEPTFFRKGALTSLARPTHPSEMAAGARMVLGIEALGRRRTSFGAAAELRARRVTGDFPSAWRTLHRLKAGLKHPRRRLNNLYAHVTMDCNLRCTHCYAQAGASKAHLPIAALETLLAQAVEAGFRQVVFTGGEPLVHPQLQALLDLCRGRRGAGCTFVLRTNLYGDLPATLLMDIARAFDQVVVSVDGAPDTHDARRGGGSYASTHKNLLAYAALCGAIPGAAQLSLACVLPAAQVQGRDGDSVRQLGEALHVKRIRFRPLLPLGRARDQEQPVACEGLFQHMTPEERLEGAVSPIASCGIGQNLYVQPDGRAFPCYAWHNESTYLGSVFEKGLDGVLASEAFRGLSACTVDTVQKCKACRWRYLCGGACRAWGNQDARDINARPPCCDHLQSAAAALVEQALAYCPDVKGGKP